MSAYDPKRTSDPQRTSSRYWLEPIRCAVLSRGSGGEATRVHQILGWHISSVVADARESPTGGVAGGRLSQWRIDHRGHFGSIPPGPGRKWNAAKVAAMV